MKKLVFLFLMVLASQLAFGQGSDDRLMELVQKKADLQAVGQDLDSKEADEFAKLAAAKGIINVAEMQEAAKMRAEGNESKAATTPQITSASKSTAPVSEMKQIGASPADKARQAQAYQNYQDKVSVPNQGTKNMYRLKDEATNPGPSEVPKEVAKDQPKPMNPNSVGGTDFVEEKSLGASSVQGGKIIAIVTPKAPKKKELTEAIDPSYNKRLKKEMNEISEMRKSMDELKKPIQPVVLDSNKASKGAIYDPVPSEPGVKQNGFVVDRDSQTIITKRVGTKDAVTIKMCIAYGVSIILDESIDTELQRVILDDKIFFDAQDFENKRGVYVRLIKPIPEGSRWESAIRLIRKSDDRTYLVNLIGVGCPEGNVDFPKVVYLKEKFDVLSARQGDIMTPEDMIIQASQGLARKNEHEVKVYDMVASPGSDWVVFGVEVQKASISKPEKIEFAALDNLQINKVNVKAEFLKLQSDKSTELRGTPTYRYKVMMAIDKTYMFKNRFVHLIYINKETKHYQYIQIDTLQYFQSLKERGFDL